MTPHAAWRYFTPKGTLAKSSISETECCLEIGLHWSVYKPIVEIDFDVVRHKCCCGQLCPSFRIMSMIVANDYSSRGSICDMAQDISTESLLYV